MPTSLNGVINNTTIKIGKTLNLFVSAEHAIAGTPIAGTVPPQVAYASNNYGTFTAQSAYWPAVSIKFNHVGQTGLWASGWINTANNLPLADPSTVTLGAIQLADAAMTLPLTITPQSSGVVHDVAVSVWNGSAWTAIKSWTGVAASTTWSLTQTNVRSMLTVFSGAGPYRVRAVVVTKKDGTTVGTSTKEVSATMATSLAPSVGGYQLTETNAKVAALNLNINNPETVMFVEGQSNPKIVLSDGVYPSYGAKLSKIEIIYDGKTILTDKRPVNDTGTSDVINYYPTLDKTGVKALSVKVTDTRGKASSYGLSVNVQPYSPPTLQNLQVKRAFSFDGPLDETGEYLRFDFYATRSWLRNSNNNEVNHTGFYVYLRPPGGVLDGLEYGWTYIYLRGLTNESQTRTETIRSDYYDAYDANKTIEILCTVEDKLNTVGMVVTLPAQKVPFSIGKDEGVGVGKVWEAGSIDIASYDSESGKGGIAIDGALKLPWPWLGEIGTVQAADDFNDLDDGYYLHIGFEATNAPMFGGLVSVNTVGNYRAQVVYGTGEIQWRIFNGSSWLPWNIAMDDSGGNITLSQIMDTNGKVRHGISPTGTTHIYDAIGVTRLALWADGRTVIRDHEGKIRYETQINGTTYIKDANQVTRMEVNANGTFRIRDGDGNTRFYQTADGGNYIYNKTGIVTFYQDSTSMTLQAPVAGGSRIQLTANGATKTVGGVTSNL